MNHDFPTIEEVVAIHDWVYEKVGKLDFLAEEALEAKVKGELKCLTEK